MPFEKEKLKKPIDHSLLNQQGADSVVQQMSLWSASCFVVNMVTGYAETRLSFPAPLSPAEGSDAFLQNDVAVLGGFSRHDNSEGLLCSFVKVKAINALDGRGIGPVSVYGLPIAALHRWV